MALPVALRNYSRLMSPVFKWRAGGSLPVERAWPGTGLAYPGGRKMYRELGRQSPGKSALPARRRKGHSTGRLCKRSLIGLVPCRFAEGLPGSHASSGILDTDDTKTIGNDIGRIQKTFNVASSARTHGEENSDAQGQSVRHCHRRFDPRWRCRMGCFRLTSPCSHADRRFRLTPSQ